MQLKNDDSFAEKMIPASDSVRLLDKIVATVTLAKIDYENFTTDMLAYRQFIEGNAALCERGAAWKCIFVHRRGRSDGVLVMPEDACFVGWAAFCTGDGRGNDERGLWVPNGYTPL